MFEQYFNRQTGQMVVKKKIEYFYNPQGLEICQKVYNSQGLFCYETSKVYDEKQRVVEERNSLGHLTTYRYDGTNNIIQIKEVDANKSTTFIYDKANRIVEKILVNSQGSFSTKYAYNYLNQVIAEIDSYGNETNYHYDRLGNKTLTVKPAVKTPEGQIIRPTQSSSYSHLDQMVIKFDENGHKTIIQNNIYGKPIEITHPDGSQERFRYFPSGRLKHKWLADGTSISYSYDGKGNLLSEAFLDATGNRLKTLEYVYRGSLLQSYKDAQGMITTYCYDGAGRKIAEITGHHEKVIYYEYDDFDRMTKVIRPLNGENGQVELYQYDWLDHVISKTLKDYQGSIYAEENYSYDVDGRLVNKTFSQNANKKGSYHYHYHSDGALKWKETPFGSRTSYKYDHNHKNELNQLVQSREILDALGRPTKEIDDSHHRAVSREVYEASILYSKTLYEYDGAGHLVGQQSFVMADGVLQREHSVRWKYNNKGLVKSETEGEKVTLFHYDSNDRVILKTNPNNVSIHYNYDALGRLKEKSSSDGSICYRYQYDVNNNPVEIIDVAHNRFQKRNYDLFNRLKTEEVSFGVVLHYQYDTFDRVTQLTLPDNSFIKYTYNPFHLLKIQRYNSSNALIFECDCLEYDLRGNLISCQSPAGKTSYEYDLLDRPINIKAPHGDIVLKEFNKLGDCHLVLQQDPLGMTSKGFAYDRFDHVVSENGLSTGQNHYKFDSIGCCLEKNNDKREINSLNQTKSDGEYSYQYDTNGNLIKKNLNKVYGYDALSRLVSISDENGAVTTLTYDGFDRCIEIQNGQSKKQLIYQDNREIGSVVNGKLDEFRLIHPAKYNEKTFAIELGGETFFVGQDYRYNISALQRADGTLAQWCRFTAFGTEAVYGEEELKTRNPWSFANRRQVDELIMFHKRFYNPKLMTWMTADPLGYVDGANLYCYVQNNPLKYYDPKGTFAFVIPLFYITWGAVETITITITTMEMVAIAASVTAVSSAAHYMEGAADRDYRARVRKEDEEHQREVLERLEKINKNDVRTEPKDLDEQLALEEAKGGAGNEIMKDKINDPQYKDKFKKKSHVHDCLDGKKSIEIHYWENNANPDQREGFKFK